MDFQDISKKSKEDLQKLLSEKREELRELRFKVAANQLTGVRKVRNVRRAIAKIQTRLKQLQTEETTTA
ncbi:50S ribosomal protein L29 [Candidatus Uhrbacteria bacterium]|jgi:large subunit ribosomal protein L29|nr:50S ribosomal protein L29 [Candidatus Uhrbacteria bacterium]HJN85350.1 50S ribosomal protein L29 [Patescibacteria group bacterium]